MDEKRPAIFLTLADTGNLTRTAEKLYLAQPTLSKRLQNMESELGATLFLRSKQGVTLTPAGEEAQKVIQRTVQDFSTLREQLQLRKTPSAAPCALRRPSTTPNTACRRYWPPTRPSTRTSPSKSPLTTAATASRSCRTANSTSPSCGANTTGTRARSCSSGNRSVSSAAGRMPMSPERDAVHRPGRQPWSI